MENNFISILWVHVVVLFLINSAWNSGCYKTFLQDCSSGRFVTLVAQIQHGRQLLEASPKSDLQVWCDIVRKAVLVMGGIWTRACSVLNPDREGLWVLSLTENSFDVFHSDKFLIFELNFSLLSVIIFTIRQTIQCGAESDRYSCCKLRQEMELQDPTERVNTSGGTEAGETPAKALKREQLLEEPPNPSAMLWQE